MLNSLTYIERLPFALPKAIDEFIACLEKGKHSPLKVCLGQAEIEAKDVPKITKALSSAKYLTHLFLVHFEIPLETLEAIIRSISKSKTLYHIDLTNTNTSASGGIAIAEYLKKNRTLGILNLDNNNITTTGAVHLAKSLVHNTFLSILTLSRNNLSRAIVQHFHEALKVNRILSTLDLGDIESINLTAIMQNNKISRTVALDRVLSKPKLCKTKFGISKIALIGESKCGKSTFLKKLLMQEVHVDQEPLLHAGNRESNFPQVKITNVRTSTRIGVWEEVQKHEHFLLEHAMKTAHLLLIKRMNAARKEMKVDILESSNRSTGDTSERERFESQTETLHDSVFSGITFSHEHDHHTGGRSSGQTFEEDFSDSDANLDEIEVLSESSESEEEFIDMETYVQNQQERYSRNLVDSFEPIGDNKAFIQLQQRYAKHGGRQTRVGEATSRIIRQRVGRVRRKKRNGSIVRAYSFDSHRLSVMSIGSERDKRGSKINSGRGKTKFAEHKASKLMTRDFTDNVFMRVKARHEGVDLLIYELSDNNTNDATFTSLYNSLLSEPGYGTIIICFDLTKLYPLGNGVSPGRQSLVYYLQLAKSKGDSKIVLVGTKLDKIKKVNKLTIINSEIKKALKEARISRIIANASSKLFFFPVDVERNYGFPELRKRIDRVSRNLQHVKQCLMLNDICLLDYILADKGCDGLRSTTDLREILFWAENLGVDRGRVEIILRLFHSQGLVLYFPKTRHIENIVVSNIDALFESLSAIFNVKKLDESFNAIYNTNSETSKTIETYSNSTRRNFLISTEMIEELCGSRTDSHFVIQFLIERAIFTEWGYSSKRFFQDLSGKKRQMNVNYSPELFFATTLLNDRIEIDGFAKLLTNTNDIEDDEILANSKEFEIFFEVGENPMLFTSSFFASLLGSVISFLARMKLESRSLRIRDYNVEVYNANGPPTIYFFINKDISFFLRGSRTGARLYIDYEKKQGALASYTILFHMIEKVKELLGMAWNFNIRIKMNGQAKTMRKIRTDSRKLRDIFMNFVGVKCFAIGGGLPAIESYFKDGA